MFRRGTILPPRSCVVLEADAVDATDELHMGSYWVVSYQRPREDVCAPNIGCDLSRDEVKDLWKHGIAFWAKPRIGSYGSTLRRDRARGGSNLERAHTRMSKLNTHTLWVPWQYDLLGRGYRTRAWALGVESAGDDDARPLFSRLTVLAYCKLLRLGLL